MTYPHSILRPTATALTAAFLLAGAHARVAAAEGDRDSVAALQAFHQRAETYAALHRQLAASLPPLGSRVDRQSLLAARAFLASAIKAARPNARQGDLFTPAVTRIVRDIVIEARYTGDFSVFVPPLDEEGRLMTGIHPRVYDSFPKWATEDLGAGVIYRLPTLPEELEYRLIDYDLVIWDIYADLIVDFIPYAATHPMSDAMYR
jgi:hypothetical protein